jgi:hypothetical protein
MVAGAAITAALAAGIVSPGVAPTDTASTPVGQFTATWDGLCHDLGVNVTVSVSGRFASTGCTAVSFPRPQHARLIAGPTPK